MKLLARTADRLDVNIFKKLRIIFRFWNLDNSENGFIFFYGVPWSYLDYKNLGMLARRADWGGGSRVGIGGLSYKS